MAAPLSFRYVAPFVQAHNFICRWNIASTIGATDSTHPPGIPLHPCIRIRKEHPSHSPPLPFYAPTYAQTKPVVGAAAAATVLGVEAVHSLVSTLANADLTRTLEPVFLFTTADNFNYKGLRAWLDEAPSTVLSSIDLAICVGDINPFQPLHMHISKPAKLDTVKALYNTITSTFADHGLAITTQRKKISLTATSLSWPHEALAKKGVLAVTLTTAAEPNNDWLKLTPAFGPAVAADDRLATVTRALADTLLALVFDEPKATLVVRALQQAAPALYAPDLTAMTAVMEHFRQYSVAPADAAARRGLESAVRQVRSMGCGLKGFRVWGGYGVQVMGDSQGGNVRQGGDMCGAAGAVELTQRVRVCVSVRRRRWKMWPARW